MPIDPFLENILPAVTLPSPKITDASAFRETERETVNALTAQLAEPYPEVHSRELVEIPVQGGIIELLIYKPFSPGPHPAYVYFFGGGFRGGSIHYDYIDGLCRERCVGADAVVISVGYRLAPENKFPTAVNDAYAALQWVAEHSEDLGARPDQLVVGGGSAGGNLAAVVALRAREQNGPAIALQILEVPALDLTWKTNLSEYRKGYLLEEAEIVEIGKDYFADPEDALNPYASPLLAEDLSGLPPAVILASEFDMVRGSSDAYARRLSQSGVPVTYIVAEGQIHSSSMMTGVLEAARTWRDDVIKAIKSVNDPVAQSSRAGAASN
jgi:acetyl esterase